ncbi:GNAT family N-acetyltransferase [Clostridia bacterium OttesenSCG-928-O13]|nr:GNAT family N-acetyltransferase [Clostridia bacterium OttesenSCG-928-O13]
MVTAFKPEQLDDVMDIWLSTNLAAHPYVPKSLWMDYYGEVRSQLPASRLYVYKDKGVVKGFIGIQGDYVAGLFVGSRWQNGGIGGQLMAHVQVLYDHLELDAYVRNKRAVAFYRRWGYAITGQKSNTETGEAEYHMVWDKTR